jgi:hypothetical protein
MICKHKVLTVTDSFKRIFENTKLIDYNPQFSLDLIELYEKSICAPCALPQVKELVREKLKVQ